MFKQAILITAYKNYNHLEEIVDFFDANFEIYIHIDRKSKISDAQIKSLKSKEIVKLVSQKFKVNWGGINHLKCILYLSAEAIKNEQNKYFHLISGHDFPVKKIQDFDFFLNNCEKDFIECFEMPLADWGVKGGYERLEYYSLYDWLDWKIIFQRKMIKKLIKFQEKIGFKRSISRKIPKLYAGSTWWSLSRKSLKYIVDYTNCNSSIFNRFKHTFCSEEFYFQTILMDSDFKSGVAFYNLRYIDWSNRNGNNPSILDETDVEKITTSNSFFARRFEYPISKKLVTELKAVYKFVEKEK